MRFLRLGDTVVLHILSYTLDAILSMTGIIVAVMTLHMVWSWETGPKCRLCKFRGKKVVRVRASVSDRLNDERAPEYLICQDCVAKLGDSVRVVNARQSK